MFWPNLWCLVITPEQCRSLSPIGVGNNPEHCRSLSPIGVWYSIYLLRVVLMFGVDPLTACDPSELLVFSQIQC